MEEGRNEFLLERPKPVGERLWRQQKKTRMWEKHPEKKFPGLSFDGGGEIL
jgi:hypothetical protein